MWLVMRGAMAARVRCLHRTYYLPSMAGIATAIYENEAVAAPFDAGPAAAGKDRRATRRHRTARRAPIRSRSRRSVKAYRLNGFLHRMIEPAHRARFLADPEAAFADAELTEDERDLVRRRDWRA